MSIYTIEEHKHRFAVWAASRASSVKGCRFSVLQGKMIIENSKLKQFVDAVARQSGNVSYPEVNGYGFCVKRRNREKRLVWKPVQVFMLNQLV